MITIKGLGMLGAKNRFPLFRSMPVNDPGPLRRGRRIGLLGGTFNPPHAAHRQISLIAMKRLRLDAVWWLVSPGNPLKDNARLPPLAERLALARAVARHPRIHPTGIEASLRTRFTVDTLRAIRRRWPANRFVWLMGADNLAQLHRWKNWRRIARLVPIAIIDRPGETHRAVRSRAAVTLSAARLPEGRSGALAGTPPPAWAFLHDRRSSLSSTALRAKSGEAGHRH